MLQKKKIETKMNTTELSLIKISITITLSGKDKFLLAIVFSIISAEEYLMI